MRVYRPRIGILRSPDFLIYEALKGGAARVLETQAAIFFKEGYPVGYAELDRQKADCFGTGNVLTNKLLRVFVCLHGNFISASGARIYGTLARPYQDRFSNNVSVPAAPDSRWSHSGSRFQASNSEPIPGSILKKHGNLSSNKASMSANQRSRTPTIAAS